MGTCVRAVRRQAETGVKVKKKIKMFGNEVNGGEGIEYLMKP